MAIFHKGRKKADSGILPYFDDEDEIEQQPVFDGKKYAERIFAEKVTFASSEIKQYYVGIKNALLSYDCMKSRISRRADTFTYDGEKVAVITFSGKNLKVHYKLTLKDSEERFFDKEETDGKYKEVPLTHRVASKRSYGYALELVERLAVKLGLAPSENQKNIDVLGEIESYLLKSDEKKGL